MEITFVSSSKIKTQELKEFFKGIPYVKLNFRDIDQEEIQSNCISDIVKHKLETSTKIYKPKSNEILLVDDTGLEFNCLNRFPGAFIKFFMRKLYLRGLVDLVERYGDHSITYVCGLGLLHNNKYMYFEGRSKYRIISSEEAEQKKVDLDTNNDWRYIVAPEDGPLTISEMSPEMFSKISPRSIVCNRLLDYINSVLGVTEDNSS